MTNFVYAFYNVYQMLLHMLTIKIIIVHHFVHKEHLHRIIQNNVCPHALLSQMIHLQIIRLGYV